MDWQKSKQIAFSQPIRCAFENGLPFLCVICFRLVLWLTALTLIWVWECWVDSRCPPSLGHCRSGYKPPDCHTEDPNLQPPASDQLGLSPRPFLSQQNINKMQICMKCKSKKTWPGHISNQNHFMTIETHLPQVIIIAVIKLFLNCSIWCTAFNNEKLL